MPELPEVETVCRGLAKAMIGQKITGVETRRGGLRIPFPANLKDVEGQKVTDITRRAKYILVQLSGKQTLLMHLGMSGRMLIQGNNAPHEPEKHDHMILTLSNGTRVVFNDPRRFGMVDLAETADVPAHKFFKHLGPEPFSKEFSAEYLLQRIKNKIPAIKVALLDQQLVVGVGNIYASEALFRAGIDPKRKAGSLKKPEAVKLIKAIHDVLNAAIKAGGSSLRDYVQADGELGYFQHHFAVYDREGQKCPGCNCKPEKTGGINRITQAARSTFYCPRKQK